MYKWHRRFSDGRASTHDDSRAGRPSVIDNSLKTQVENVIGEDRRLTVREIATACDTGKTMVHKILTEHLGVERVCARWVPRLLSDKNKMDRVKAARSLMIHAEI